MYISFFFFALKTPGEIDKAPPREVLQDGNGWWWWWGAGCVSQEKKPGSQGLGWEHSVCVWGGGLELLQRKG